MLKTEVPDGDLMVTWPLSQDLRWAATSLLFHSLSARPEQLVASVLWLSLPLTARDEINNINNMNNNDNI